MERVVGQEAHSDNTCQQDLCLLAHGHYPGVEPGQQASVARLIVSRHLGLKEPLVSWREATRAVVDALLVPEIIGQNASVRSLFLVQMRSARSPTGGCGCEVDYYKRVIEGVLGRVATTTRPPDLTGADTPRVAQSPLS